MYYFFLSLVHVSFRGSFMKYNKSLLKSIAIIFTIICIFIIHRHTKYWFHPNPKQCSTLTVSKLSTITMQNNNLYILCHRQNINVLFLFITSSCFLQGICYVNTIHNNHDFHIFNLD